MPIVSGLSTVWVCLESELLVRTYRNCSPASLYTEVKVGGLINITTKTRKNALFSADAFSTDWGEVNVDIGFKANVGKAGFLTGINYFNYSNPIDNNKDNLQT
jgi:outer membrane receptor for ferrienterochelin and colicins